MVTGIHKTEVFCDTGRTPRASLTRWERRLAGVLSLSLSLSLSCFGVKKTLSEATGVQRSRTGGGGWGSGVSAPRPCLSPRPEGPLLGDRVTGVIGLL